MISGKVVKGDGLGKSFGYPTANLDIKKMSCKAGVYAVEAYLEKKKYQGAMAFREKPLKVEIYLLNYTGEDFYGKFMEVELIQKVGELERYDDVEELKEKIASDMEKVKQVLEEV